MTTQIHTTLNPHSHLVTHHDEHGNFLACHVDYHALGPLTCKYCQLSQNEPDTEKK